MKRISNVSHVIQMLDFSCHSNIYIYIDLVTLVIKSKTKSRVKSLVELNSKINMSRLEFKRCKERSSIE